MVVPGRALVRPGTKVKGSEGYSPGKLNDARQIVLAGYLAYVRTPAGGRIELCSVEEVEELSAELEPKSAIRTELRVFECGEIKVLLSVVANVWLGA